MEVRIGVRNVAREVVIESEQTQDEVAKAVSEAIAAGTPVTLTDEKGHTVIVPGDALGYVDIAPEQGRRVGFGS